VETAEIVKHMPLWKKSFVDFAQSDFGFYVPQRWDDYQQEWSPAPGGKGFPITWPKHKQRLLRWAFTLDDDGLLPVTSMWVIDGKKTGKTTDAAALADWFGRFHERNADIQLAANALNQVEVRVFQQLKWSLQHNPYTHMIADVKEKKIVYYKTNNVARAIPSKATTQAGGNPVLVQVDEPWGYNTKADREFLDELAPSPTLKLSFRFFTSYPPYEGDEGPMVDVINAFFNKDGRPKKGVDRVDGLEDMPVYVKDGIAVYWNHDLTLFPWHTERYLNTQKNDPTVSPASYARFYEVRMASREDTFMPMGRWDDCTDEDFMPLGDGDHGKPMVMAVDLMGGKVYSDCSAIVCRGYEPGTDRYPLLAHKVWDPSIIDNPDYDFNLAAEEYILDMHRRHKVLACGYDPTQFVGSAKKLKRMGVNMVEITQVNSRAVADTQYRNLILGRRLRNYPQSRELRDHVSRAMARELGDGNIRIDKRLASGRIDACVADSMCCLMAMQNKPKFTYLAKHPKTEPPPVRRNVYKEIFWGATK
jgi:hypothetical protein